MRKQELFFHKKKPRLTVFRSIMAYWLGVLLLAYWPVTGSPKLSLNYTDYFIIYLRFLVRTNDHICSPCGNRKTIRAKVFSDVTKSSKSSTTITGISDFSLFLSCICSSFKFFRHLLSMPWIVLTVQWWQPSVHCQAYFLPFFLLFQYSRDFDLSITDFHLFPFIMLFKHRISMPWIAFTVPRLVAIYKTYKRFFN